MSEFSDKDDSQSFNSMPGRQTYWVDILHGPMLAWLILFVSLLITLVAWTISNEYAEEKAQQRFEFHVENAQDAIQKRFLNYEQVLRSGLGLFKSSGFVSREEWHSFITTLEIDKFFPGTLGVGYASWLEPGELKVHVDTVRKQGFPEFSVRPEGKREHYSSIVYLEPFNDRNKRAFGFDMYSEPVRRAAMSRARDSGQSALSGKVTLVQETNAGVQAGFLIYMPHYTQEAHTVDERRNALTGFVYSALRIGDLMQGILGKGLPELDFAIYDGASIDSESLLFRSSLSMSGSMPQFHVQRDLSNAGHSWLITYSSNAAFDVATSSNQPTFVAVGGIIIDFLLFNVILSLGRTRKHALMLADERMKKLSESELQFKAITDNANDGIISIDDGGFISYLNNIAQNIFSYSSQEIVGRSVAELFSAEMKQTILAFFETSHNEAALSLDNGLIELEGIDSQGRAFPLEFSLARWRVNGRMHYTAIVRDISERKKLENIKNEFISTVSHELRTPLTAISGSLALLENGATGELSGQAQDLVKNAKRNSVRLGLLVNDLLDSEKMASGNMRYNMQVCELIDLIEAALDVNRGVAVQKSVSLHFDGQQAVKVNVDPDRFLQVMTNLLANAIKFSPSGDCVETRLEVDSDFVRVSVIDHGSGVPDEFRERIFGKFAQADSSDTRNHGGTGLGLSIVKVIIEKFEGHIDYSSIPGKETTFFFTLPIYRHYEV